MKSPLDRDLIISQQAQHYFALGRYSLAANYFAECMCIGFETVCLQFFEKEKKALKEYLEKRLDIITTKKRPSNGPQIQQILLVTWLVELGLSKLNELKDVVERAEQLVQSLSERGDIHALQSSSLAFQRAAEAEQLEREDFKMFLEKWKDRMDRLTTYELLTDHGMMAEYVYFATIVGDHEKVIEYYMRQKEWNRALEALDKQVRSFPSFHKSLNRLTHPKDKL